MKKFLLSLLLLPLLAACGPNIVGNPATTTNVGVLGKAYAAAQSIALVYDALPFCSKTTSLVCANPHVVVSIATADKAATLAWNELVSEMNKNLDITNAFAAAQSAIQTLQNIEKLYNAAGATS